MESGSLETAKKGHAPLALVLVGVIVVCTVVLGVADPSKPVAVGVTVLSTVAGAALGNFLRIDLTDGVVRNQARPATRHLFDQIRRMRSLVVNVEGHSRVLRNEDVAPDRAADWFASIGDSLRAEIDATATAIENWSDLAEDVRQDEWTKYMQRDSRLPEASGSTDG